ncbi:MAG: hypothetical protein IJ172_11230 [Ruminococcus sp.]|nr:hypothetical protein [Ruminococcus sp.]
MKKRILAIVLSLTMAAACFTGCGDSNDSSSKKNSSVSESVSNVSTAESSNTEMGEPTQTGTCGKNGDNVKWSLFEDGTVVVEGIGEMHKYVSDGEGADAPVFRENSLVKKVIVKEGVTEVTDMFAKCENLTSVEVSSTVTSFKMSSLPALEEIIIPGELRVLDIYRCEKLKVIKGKAGSKAETFAKENGISFEAI